MRRHASRCTPRLLAALLAVLAAAVLPSSARAQGWIDIERPHIAGGPADPVVRVSSSVTVTIDGRVARVEVEERFRNTAGGLAEGSYLYPMPGEAVFQNFSLWMGNQEMKGEMMNADQARGIYEEIVRRKRDPALLTYAGLGLIRAQVFPIQPGETRKVVLRYTQLLPRTGDALRFRYTLGRVDGPPMPRGENDPRRDFVLRLQNAELFGTPYSPTHELNATRRADPGGYTLETGARGDVEIFLPLREHLVGTTVVAHAPGGEDGYFMLLLSPPAVGRGSAIPRDLTLVVDVSGSMSGTKLEQAKAALNQALGTLSAADRFRIVAFSSAVRSFREDFAPATRGNLAAGREFIDGLSAEGGTNIAGALDAVLDTPSDGEQLPLIVFITDGLPSVGEQSPERIAERAAGRRGQARIFTVGVGVDVNTYLLDRLAKEGRGTAEYVGPDASVEAAMSGLTNKLRFPALVNLRIVDAPVRLVDGEPAALPDLFYGEELVVLGRYRGNGTGDVVVEGERNGRRERFTARAVFPRHENDHDYLPRLWASRRIGTLTRQIRLEGASSDLIAQVRDLGLRYGIPTEYTSYLVQEPDQVAQSGGLRRERPILAQDAAAPAVSPPAAQTGAGAFESARRSSNLAAAKSLAATNEIVERDAAKSKDSRRVEGRMFLRRNGAWTDAAHTDSLKVTTVAPYSDAYFELVRALPELAPYLAIGDDVTVAGKRGSIRIAATGIKKWSAGALPALVKTFRGV